MVTLLLIMVGIISTQFRDKVDISSSVVGCVMVVTPPDGYNAIVRDSMATVRVIDEESTH